jgi:hypothetical protein
MKTVTLLKKTTTPEIKRFSLLFMGVLFLTASLNAGFVIESVTLEELAPSASEALKRGETVTELQLKNPDPVLVPRDSYLQFLIANLAAELQPGIMVESLRLYTKPASSGNGSWTEEERTALYNRSLALSSLAGLEYFSTSRNAMRTFYETSGVIDGPESRRPLPDPVYAAPPEYLSVFARQKDLTFGDNVYQYEYYARPKAIILVQQNLSPMKVAIIPAIARNNLRSVTAVIDAGPYLLLYTCALVKAASLPGLGGRIGASFSTRVEAVTSWFMGQADKAFEQAPGAVWR